MQKLPWAQVGLLGIDVDGTLTDGFLYWAGPEVGWTQRYAVRDGEAILRLTAMKLPVVPISRNKTLCAKTRVEHLKLPSQWMGVSDKEAALQEVCAAYDVTPREVCYVGDGREDTPILQRVGLGVSVADGHPAARATATYVTQAPGGRAAVEEVVERILEARGWLA